ncbi:DNA polymerase III alpha subunit [Lachnospiraceae bacterium TWA4]|nr:DNA polymerase III alpha subunit [Lachnospiraceae bacterium TWA4]
MQKTFSEVMPDLKVPDSIKSSMQWLSVGRVVTCNTQQLLKIYVTATRLVDKVNLNLLEASIKKQYFDKKDLRVRIIERYELSSAYTFHELLKEYQPSLLKELKGSSVVLYNLYKHSKLDYNEETGFLKVSVPDSIVNRKKGEELSNLLMKVFNERFDCRIEVQMDYYQVEEKTVETPSVIEVEIARVDEENRKNYEKKKQEAAKKAESKQEFKKDFNPEFKNKKSYKKPMRKKSENTIYGRDIEGIPIKLDQVIDEMGEIVIEGEIIELEFKELKTGNFMVIFDVYDGTDTISVKIFCRADRIDELRPELSKGLTVCVKGMTSKDKFDGELIITSVTGIMKANSVKKKTREDKAEVKRVELHCHTKFSEMDAVTAVSDLIKRVKSWGQPAIALTDHGCVQAFTEAFHVIDHDDPLKIIYGLEGYLVDDSIETVKNPREYTLSDNFVVFDIETTGLNSTVHEIIEIGAVKVSGGKICDRYSVFVKPTSPIPLAIEELTSISDEMVKDAKPIEEILPEFLEFSKDCVLVAHNASFDVGFITKKASNMGITIDPTVIDTVSLARYLLPSLKRFKLDTVAKALNISLDHHHRAVDDAECTARIFEEFIKRLEKKNLHTLKELNEAAVIDVETIKKLPMYHIILLAKNHTGRVNLYKMVSESHLTYFSKRPRIPRSLLEECREGIIVGSACEAGELFRSILNGASDQEIAKICQFYDYLEIQPIGNNQFLIREDKYGIESDEDLRDLNRKIVNLGIEFDKPVVATCDSHFLDPEDEIYRRILLAGQGFHDADTQPPLFLRTTEEMLAEFDYLGEEKAYEVVVENTNYIADMCDRISPVRPDKCPPVIPDSDKTLREICYTTAKKMYGEDLPPIVVERLERELNSIISNGFAVMYIIAQKLVWKSNEDGYLVGSRGSVGSSFVATMAGITEVNPLSPHYYCPSCHFYDFDSDEVRKFKGLAGCDMPDRTCPNCGKPLKKDGFDIPFETFLGFKGNKEPDIDLNFSGEYQSHAHDYTEVIFGKGHTFRAGTIGTLADKTAYGYVSNYFKDHGTEKRKCEINRLLQGCVGIKRSTGQHPGGIIVMPHGEEIYSFTPIQHPANDMTTKIITTHFDYHSIDHNLLKLDILGHDDPTMIRMLEDLTGINAKDIPLDSKDVMSLFQNTDALGITPDDIGGCKLGALGIPEFGTDFAMQMLIDTQPKYFSDLVRIAGLAHGTDVWLGNAQTLILEGTATIQTAICTRDDIMTYLIGKGMDSELSFTIMEFVRKGKGLKPEWEKAMKEADVPDWYIGSCKKIKYMFPKAHAAAYVMMAWRIAYCKIFYPLAYYAAFFSIRASGFTYELMCQGRKKLENHLADYRRRQDSLSKKEQDTLKDMRLVQEMYARGFEFMPIDIYRVDATRFQVIDGKIMPSLTSIDGMGEVAAQTLVDAAKEGKFLSKEDLRNRTKVSSTLVDLMDELGILGDMAETNQLSIFDMMGMIS